MKLRFPRTTTYDLPLVLVVLALLLLGLAMVYSASGITALDANEDPGLFLAQQSAWAALGIAAMLGAARADYHRLRLFAVPLLLLAVALLVAVLVPGVGVTAGGATRWLRFGGLVGLQPAELAKLALIVYLATWLGARRKTHCDLLPNLGPEVSCSTLCGALTRLSQTIIFLRSNYYLSADVKC